MNEYKGIMPIKIELTLEQSQQGVSNDVLKTLRFELETLSRRFFESTITGYIKMEMVMPIPAEVEIYYHMLISNLQKNLTIKHRDSRIMKAQGIKDKELRTNSNIQDSFLKRYQVYQGRLLASFQDDAKYEHVGQGTRSQGGKDDQDGRIKI
ncbi:hypothetical protein Tco_0174308 [Tanacetum coccineum]